LRPRRTRRLHLHGSSTATLLLVFTMSFLTVSCVHWFSKGIYEPAPHHQLRVTLAKSLSAQPCDLAFDPPQGEWNTSPGEWGPSSVSLTFFKIAGGGFNPRKSVIWVHSVADGGLYDAPLKDQIWLRLLIGEYYQWPQLTDWNGEVISDELTGLDGREFLVVRFSCSYRGAMSGGRTFDHGVAYIMRPACPTWHGLLLACLIDSGSAAEDGGPFPEPGIEAEFLDTVRSMKVE
jgi:hypothetical protein